jgi:hypothetical protein
MADSGEAVPTLIRTGLRDRLPPGLSYPVGAELISHHLADVPQYKELWIAFNKHRPGMGIDRPKGVSGFQQVLGGHWDHSGGWSLTVFAVPSVERSAVRRLLQENGLPSVRAWLRAHRPQTWFTGMRCFEVGYLLSGGRVGVLESQDHRTLTWSLVAEEAR